MAHMMIPVKCKNGHNLLITLDRNECGCYHNGDPCIILSCGECFMESFKKWQAKDPSKIKQIKIVIPLGKGEIKQIEEVIK